MTRTLLSRRPAAKCEKLRHSTPTISVGSPCEHPLEHHGGHHEGDQSTDFLEALAEEVGRKFLHYELRVSKTLIKK
jgi:hypothetical protein